MTDSLPNAESPDFDRRFGGVARLYGTEALARFRGAHVAVIGIGGVGSWVVEALARSGIGALTLVDLDHVAESNINRQIHALDGTLGLAKTEAMARRIHGINPECQVAQVDDFIAPDNLDTLLGGKHFDLLVDAIDGVRAKTHLIAWCKTRGLPLVTVGGAGGQLDPTRIRLEDLSRTVQDPLLAKVRSQLRRDHGFPRDPKKKFGIEAVYSDEPLRYPASGAACEVDEGVTAHVNAHGPTGLNCAGFGSSICVTASFGLAAASAALRRLAIPPL